VVRSGDQLNDVGALCKNGGRMVCGAIQSVCFYILHLEALWIFRVFTCFSGPIYEEKAKGISIDECGYLGVTNIGKKAMTRRRYSISMK